MQRKEISHEECNTLARQRCTGGADPGFSNGMELGFYAASNVVECCGVVNILLFRMQSSVQEGKGQGLN